MIALTFQLGKNSQDSISYTYSFVRDKSGITATAGEAVALKGPEISGAGLLVLPPLGLRGHTLPPDLKPLTHVQR